MSDVRATIIVPVYQAVEDLDRCLTALERTLPAGTRVFVADDASPDPAVPQCIARHVASGRLQIEAVRRETNLGFVGNVNRAFAETAPDDVILFNSDAWATPGWYETMMACAASDGRIATITPWSNNAEICSLPDFCRAAPVPSEAEADRIARTVRNAGSPAYPELPTGVGFCMFVRRAALSALGDFDAATFGRGYGEENDFCQRAAGHGWRNVLCDAAYVVHRGGASFGPEGHRPGGENLARLTARYPHYNAQVADFILRDPLAPLRERIVAALAAAPQQAGDGGGTQRELFPPG
ncbi:glycosyltransferase family 2 protein [Xanthomonadaceae bacterium XH05]|nr:glycosyltransferase family 2 protein [Xanthomonadaceae bacterium XH05]